MQPDYRLEFIDSATYQYRKRQKQELADARQAIQQNVFDNVSDWLVFELLNQVDKDQFSRCPMPNISALSLPMQKAIFEIHRCTTKQKGIINFTDPLVLAIGESVAQKLAYKSGDDFDIWIALLDRIHEQYELYTCWVEHLPVTAIKKNIKKLIKGPTAEHPLALIETWGAYRSKSMWPSFDANIKEQKVKSNDRWSYISKIARISEEWHPGKELCLYSDLLQRTGWTHWLKWVARLPSVSLQYLMLCQIRALDVCEEIMTIGSTYTEIDAESRLNLLILIVLSCLQLWGQINQNLRHWADNRTVMDEDDKKYRQVVKIELDKWINAQMYECAQKIVSILDLKSAQGQEIAYLALTNLQVQDRTRDFPAAMLRQAIVDQLKERPDHALVITNQLLSSLYHGGKKLVSTWGILGNLEGVIHSAHYTYKLWNYYSDWLQSPYFNWHGTFGAETDDAKLILAMAELLAKLEDPVACWHEVYSSIYYPSEGWAWQFKKYTDSLDRIAHLLIVGIMAPENLLNNGRDVQGARLFKLVWDKILYSIRNNYGYSWNSIRIPLSLCWSNLPYVLGEAYSDVALKAMKKTDDDKLLVDCAKWLWSSVEKCPDLVNKFAPLSDYIKKRIGKDFVLHKEE